MPSLFESRTESGVVAARPGGDHGIGESGPVHWMAAAACREVPTAVFYDPATENEAIAYCAGCAVRSACLDHALRTAEPEGVWGGLPARHRHDLLVGRPVEDRRRGRRRHLSDEDLCDLLGQADPDRPAVAQLLERVPLSTAGAYLYLARARELGLVERRGRLLYPAAGPVRSARAQPSP
jgi:WhiB family redox-sensing transcriptional regulator